MVPENDIHSIEFLILDGFVEFSSSDDSNALLYVKFSECYLIASFTYTISNRILIEVTILARGEFQAFLS